MKVLVLNCGSSSIKYQLYDAASRAVAAQGTIGRIAEDPDIPDHGRALELILDVLQDPNTGVLEDLSEVSAVGHRVVHGGSFFSAPALITPEVVAKIEEVAALAPLHNPPILLGIKEAKRVLAEVPQVAVFDTAFHATIPPKAHVYALPHTLYVDHGIRRYGFHGISFDYVTRQADRLLPGGVEANTMVIAHLGNGASITAVDRGRSVDTSMGLTPLEGLVMGTRGGDVDPGVVLFLMRELGLSAADLDRLLNKESGLLGLSGAGNDMRDVLARAKEGDERSRLAIDVYTYRLKKYIGAYAAAMGGLNAVVFTAGVGENSPEIRRAVCDGLEFLGIALDEEANATTRGLLRDISSAHSRVRVLVVPTDESRLIAEETVAMVDGLGPTVASSTGA